jgi:hypothetical protein
MYLQKNYTEKKENLKIMELMDKYFIGTKVYEAYCVDY